MPRIDLALVARHEAGGNRTMPPHPPPRSASAPFSHVMADNALLYRAILHVFAASKRQFRLHLRPDDALIQAAWASGGRPISPWCEQSPPELRRTGGSPGRRNSKTSQRDRARVVTCLSVLPVFLL